MGEQYKVFIDGGEGTTGLKIHRRFQERSDIRLLQIDEGERKDPAARKRLINQSDFTFLCLPDRASEEAVSLIEKENTHTRIIDASTAHRINPRWVYGFPELSAAHRYKLSSAKRVAVPGCYASGFVACIYPLVKAEILPGDYPVTCHGISGYSGGGKKMIALMEGSEKPESCFSPRQYALRQDHKHLPEMQHICGLEFPPVFIPVVDDYYSGMVVSVPLHTRILPNPCSRREIHDILSRHYKGQPLIKVKELDEGDLPESGFLPANVLAGTDEMEISVCGNDKRIVIAAAFDNLGKGASGAAMQCMNIMMGIDETTGLLQRRQREQKEMEKNE